MSQSVNSVIEITLEGVMKSFFEAGFCVAQNGATEHDAQEEFNRLYRLVPHSLKQRLMAD